MQEGVYKDIGSGWQVVADLNTVVPGQATAFSAFGAVAIDPGFVVFEGFDQNQAPGLYTDAGGALSKIVAVGDSLGGKVVTGLRWGQFGLGSGQVAFAATFADGSAAVSVATLCGAETPTIVQPADVTATTAPGQTTVVVNYPAPTVLDPCGGVTVICVPASGSAFPVGTTKVTVTATSGGSGLSSSCSFNVIVTQGYRCPLSQGYWKNNPGAWPASSLTLGSQTYTRTELLALLKTTSVNDASLVLARQLIAAKLNLLNQAQPLPAVVAAIADADYRLAAYTGKLPYNVKPPTPAGQAMLADASLLDTYNTGQFTPGCLP